MEPSTGVDASWSASLLSSCTFLFLVPGKMQGHVSSRRAMVDVIIISASHTDPGVQASHITRRWGRNATVDASGFGGGSRWRSGLARNGQRCRRIGQRGAQIMMK